MIGQRDVPNYYADPRDLEAMATSVPSASTMTSMPLSGWRLAVLLTTWG